MKLGNTRDAIHDALAWGYLQKNNGFIEYMTYLAKIDKSGFSRDNTMDFLEAGYICAAINILPGHLGAWLKFSYGPEDSRTIQSMLASHLRFQLFPISNPKKHYRMIAIAETSLEGYRLRIHQNRDLPLQIYAERSGVWPANWDRDGWEKRKDEIHDTIRNWDAEGVGQISRMVKALRGDLEGQRPAEVLSELRA